MPPFRGPTPVRPIYYFGNKKSNTILVQMVERHQVRFIDKEMAMIRELAGTDDFLLACVRVIDWNEDLTPWVAPGIFGNSDFSGLAPHTLDYLLQEMIPEIIRERARAVSGEIAPFSDFSSLFPPISGSTHHDPEYSPHSEDTFSEISSESSVRFFLGGYSLAALFCLWTAYQTDTFSGIAAASPSLWYPNFIEYMEDNQILTDAVYLSIGTKEESIRNHVMSRVGDGIRAADKILSRQGILNTLEWNPGKHFQDQEKRTAMGFAWLLKNRIAWTLLD